MPRWLEAHLSALPLDEEMEEYLLGRGVKEETIRAEGMKTWRNLSEPAPDAEFQRLCRPHGERLEGMLIIPVRSPRGQLLGFEARSIHEKRIVDFRLPAAKWTPFFIGTRKAMPAIWAGGDVWIGEGVFDLAALEWVAPMRDAVLASVRASLTAQHVEFLRRFCRGTVRMVYDRDETGRKAIAGYVDPKTGKWRRGLMETLGGVDKKTGRCLGCFKDGGTGKRCRECGLVRLDVVDVNYTGGKDPGEIWDKGGEPALRAAFL